jgi:predicted AAA+ superfamily ATPase
VREAMTDTPVILVVGPRQSGKSTLVQSIADDAAYVTFDDAPTRAAAMDDVTGFLRGLPSPAIIDEVQRVPDVFLAIKAEVDRQRTPGRFILTGSADVMLLPRIAESLAGRMETHTLWPLSQGELAGLRERFIDVLFDPSPLPRLAASLSRDEIFQRARSGGYPEVLQRASPERRRSWFRGYTTSMVQREVQEIAAVEGLSDIPRLLQLSATRVGSLVNFTTISRDIGIPLTTVRRYEALLRATYMVSELPAWSNNVGRRVIHTPKLYLCDSGLLSYLRGGVPDPPFHDPDAGPLLENFVLMEIRKQAGWSTNDIGIYFYRNHANQEVDIVLEHHDGRIVGIEVKAATAIQARDWRGLNVLREQAGERFVRGIVLHPGDQVLPIGERTWALPIEAVWRMGAEPITAGR